MKNTLLEIEVKQKHIDKGDEGEPDTCAIALAVSEQFGLKKGDHISVNSEVIEITKSNGFSFDLTWTDLPRLVKNFLHTFDEDKTKAKPFKFKLPFIKVK